MTLLSRRQLLLGLLAAAGASACGPVFEIRTTPSEGATSGSSVRLDPSPSPAASDPSEASTPTVYEPLPGEAYPAAKRLAGRFVQSLATYDPGVDARKAVRAAEGRTHPDFDIAAAIREAAPLFLPGARSAAEIVYPQLGGLDPHAAPDRAAVMVVVRQELELDNGTSEQVTRTVDVRLRVHRD